ncbi:hypothetical protein C0J52_27467, partial [Blattella germanica]
DKSPPGPRRTVSTPENRERVRLSAIRSPKRSARSRAASLGMSDKTISMHEDMLRRVMGDFTRRLGECIENEEVRPVFSKYCFASTRNLFSGFLDPATY